MYVHTSDGFDPTGRIAGNRDGYKLSIDDTSYITWQDLETYTINRWLDYSSSPPGWITYHIFDNVTFLYASSGIMTMRQDSHHNIWQNCEFGWAENGIGGAASPHGNGSLSPHDVIISNCTFHDIGVYVGDSDAHAIAWQGGYNNTFENNEMYNVGSGITIYGYPDQGFWNYTIRWNYVHGTHTIDGANGRGIELNNDANGIYTGNKVYGNIVTDCNNTAYRTKTTNMSYFYNNIAKNCQYGIYILGSAGASAKTKLRNNIFFNLTYNIWWSTGGMDPGEYILDSDYNLFYPETGEKLRFADSGGSDTYSFTEWQALSRPNCIFDPNSLTLDPLFADPENGDFRLQSNSPAIDNGTDIGLTLDFAGNSIPQGNGTDIGAYEYVSGSPPQTCSDGTLYGVCSSTHPQYCDNGVLVDDCDTCLCPGGYDCLVNGSCQVPIPGDLNNDGDVDIFDLNILALHFGQTQSHQDWNATADIVSNNEIDVYDLVFVARRFT